MFGSRYRAAIIVAALVVISCKSKTESEKKPEESVAAKVSGKTTETGTVASLGLKVALTEESMRRVLRIKDGTSFAKRFAAVDKDSDGKLDGAEVDDMLDRWTKDMMSRDKNGDGKLSPKEFGLGREIKGPRLKRFQSLDGDGDGSLKPEELRGFLLEKLK